MKKPPDVMLSPPFNFRENLSPIAKKLLKWVNLSNWAIDNGDKYLRDRADQMILKLLDE